MKRHKENVEKYDSSKEYALSEAVEILSSFKSPKFDESIDLSVNLGVDPKHADQLIRGTVSLPHGTGKDIKVVAICSDDDKDRKSVV